MRFFIFFNVLSASAIAFAHVASPVEAREFAGLSVPVLENRAPNCQRDFTEVADVVQGAFTGKAQLTYSISGGGITWSVCTIINHNAGTSQPCSAYALAVALSVGSIIQRQQDRATPATGTTTSSRRDLPNAASNIFVDNMIAHGFTWGEIETPAVTRRDNTSNDVTEYFIIRDVLHPDPSITPADVHYKEFTNGTGYLHFVHQPANSDLQKRHEGAGFKYNWLCGYYDGKAANVDIKSLSFQLGASISQNWAYDADYFALDQWIGAVGIDYILVKLIGVGIRIIPELRGFGEEYENVNICGDMTTPIHDELK
jgi:hypothetical protein